MDIGVPAETKTDEHRVGLTPGAAGELVNRGHKVTVETGAGAPNSMKPERTKRPMHAARAHIAESNKLEMYYIYRMHARDARVCAECMYGHAAVRMHHTHAHPLAMVDFDSRVVRPRPLKVTGY